MTLSYLKPPIEIDVNDPVSTTHSGGTPEGLAPGYVLPAGAGPATWFMQALFTMKARALDTNGQFSVVEQFAPRGFAAPAHTHSNTTEAFYVLDGEMDFAVGDTVYRGIVAGGFAYVPHSTRHEFRVVSETAKFLLITTPGGFEKYFEALSSPATAYELPSTEHRQLTPDEVIAAKRLYGAMPTNDGTLFEPREHAHDDHDHSHSHGDHDHDH